MLRCYKAILQKRNDNAVRTPFSPLFLCKYSKKPLKINGFTPFIFVRKRPESGNKPPFKSRKHAFLPRFSALLPTIAHCFYQVLSHQVSHHSEHFVSDIANLSHQVSHQPCFWAFGRLLMMAKGNEKTAQKRSSRRLSR